MAESSRVYLFRPEIRTFEEAIRSNSEGWQPRAFLDQAVFDAQMWIKANYEVPPSLVNRYGKLVNVRDIENNRNSSSVLLIRASGRVFAECTGVGHTLLEKHRAVNDFGTVLATNLGDPQRIRAIGSKVYGQNQGSTLFRQRRGSAVQSLLPPSRMYAIQMVLAEPNGNQVLGISMERTVEGSQGFLEKFTFTTLGERQERFEKYHSIYEGGSRLPESVLTSRPMHIRRTDPLAMKSYDTMIAEILDRNPNDTVTFELPFESQLEISSAALECRIGNLSFEPDNVDWDQVGEMLSANGTASVDRLLRIRVSVTANGVEVGNPTLLSCLRYETDYDCDYLVHQEDGWSIIPASYMLSINATLNEYEEDLGHAGLPVWQNHWDEHQYNAEVGKLRNWHCLHPALWYGNGTRGGVELADLLRIDGRLVHLKEYKQGGKSISHLVHQARNAATVLSANAEARGWLNDHGSALGLEFQSSEKSISLVLGVRRTVKSVSALPTAGGKLAIARVMSELAQQGFRPTVSIAPIGQA
ncbi:MAG: TIGR04141 family sporadically distributed protein [Chloroflexia bacterium]|nr:TIGR04141 family sporadically distributed protein [Chloroflexia bacterium]